MTNLTSLDSYHSDTMTSSFTADVRMFDCDSLPCFVPNISTGGEGVKIGIGNISDAALGHNAGGIGVGNNCNVSGESCSYNDVRLRTFIIRSSFDLCDFTLFIFFVNQQEGKESK